MRYIIKDALNTGGNPRTFSWSEGWGHFFQADAVEVNMQQRLARDPDGASVEGSADQNTSHTPGRA